MPYEQLTELPESVREHFPDHAQEIYMESFNSAWEQYEEPEERRGGRSREETAHAVAWAAVKRAYEKPTDTAGSYQWQRKQDHT